MQNAQPVFRFAPSPNGYLHLGHAYSALFTQAMARRYGGRMLLRIENIDLSRARPEYEAAIYEDLAWLGLEWEEPVRRQSEHYDAYAAAIAQLDAFGLLYPCFATRSEIAEAAREQNGETTCDPDGAPIYPKLYRNASKDQLAARIAAGGKPAFRLKMDEAVAAARRKTGGPVLIHSMTESYGPIVREAQPERWGDIVVQRKDVPTSYHMSVVTDDAIQGVTHITRGMDLFAATDIHRILQILLDRPEPLYCHHRLIPAEDGRKLSKSSQDKSLRALRAEGVTADQIKQMVKFNFD